MRYLFIVFGILFQFTVVAQRYYFRSYSTPEGLTQSQVSAIVQDESGYLWVGTLGGISKFNGHSFVNYSAENGLLSNRIVSLKFIQEKLYIGHIGGISVYENDQFSTVQFKNEFKNISVTDIVSFQNKLILATSGNGLYELKNKTLVPIPIFKNEFSVIRNLLVWNNELYIGTRDGIVRTSDLKEYESFAPEIDESISSMAIRNDELVIATFFEGLYFYNRNQNKIIRQQIGDKGELYNHIMVDNLGILWVSTSNGLLKINQQKEVFFDKTKGLPVNVIGMSFEDADHNIWLGTQGKGLVKVAKGEIAFYDKSMGLASDLILCGFQAASKSYYFGTMDGGVIKTNDFKHYKHFEIPTVVWSSVNDVDGKHWFGTKFGLYSIDEKDKLLFYDENVQNPGQKITSLYRLNKHEMYIGGSEGLVKYSHGVFKKVGKTTEEIGTIRSVYSKKETLLVGTDYGLFQLKNNHYELIGNLNKMVFSIVQLANGKIFIGAEDGLYQLTNNVDLKRIRYSNSVASNYINFISVERNDLILGTNNGLFILNANQTPKLVKRIGISDGLIDLETNVNSNFIDSKNQLWFGTSSGLVQMNLNKVSRQTYKAALKFVSVLMDYESFDYSKYDAKLERGIPQMMHFPYFKRNLQFNFDGVAINNYEDISFQFKVDGLDEAWSPLTKNPSLTLNGLSAGEYVVRARMVLMDGSVLDEVNIHFIVKQAFYKTVWFIVMMSLLVIGLVVLIMMLRFKREQTKNKLKLAEYKSRLSTLEQQSLNASMNRHFIFNSLNSIQYFINISDKLSANKYLSSFAKLIRKNLDSSAENNSMVTLAEELDRIELYLSLEAMRFKDKFDYAIHCEDVDLESILIPAMMIQPFVENSIIHGVLPQIERKGEIIIAVNQQQEHIQIEIIDNGIGIEKSLKSKVGDHGDHKSQGMEITMKRIELLKKISGQNMQIIGPNQTYTDNNEISGTKVTININ